MKILFVHQSFPGQYFHLAQRLAAQPGNEIVFLTQRQNGELPGVRKIIYHPRRTAAPDLHGYLGAPKAAVLNAQEVARAALELRRSGFIPDVMAGHNSWGEIWRLKDVFPEAPLLGYFEFFHHAKGADMSPDVGADADFDPEASPDADALLGIRTKNFSALLGLDTVDLGQCPTEWQRSRYPAEHQSLLRVVHEGIQTAGVVPDPRARLRLPDGQALTANDEVVTYVARVFDQRRGFPSFMRSLPEVLARRPKAQVVIVGGDEGGGGREIMLSELGDSLDLSRVHFLGWTAHPTYLKALQVSRAHVYLTHPLALSRSMLEAMSSQCLVIGSRTAPVEEVIRHGENGLLVDFSAPHEIAETVINALAEPMAFARLRANARRTLIERYDLNSVCLPKQLALLRELMEMRPAPSPRLEAPPHKAEDREDAETQQQVAEPVHAPPTAGERPGDLLVAERQTSQRPKPERQKTERPPAMSPLGAVRLRALTELAASQTNEEAPLNDALLLLSRWRSVSLQQTFIQQCGSTVLGGVVKGLSFPPTSDGSHLSKLLGCYKQPLQPYLEAAIHAFYPVVLHLGCSEGYFAVGMARRMPGTRVMAFDANPRARQACAELAAKNGVAQRVTVGAEFGPEDFGHYVGEHVEQPVLALCDIEGAERELLDPAKAPALAEIDLIVEAHEYLSAGIAELLINRFGATHSVFIVEDNGERQAPKGLTWFNKLSHLDQLLARLEWRSGPAPWLVLKSKARRRSEL